MELLKKEVIELEWQMFTSVQNEGSRASCQDDRVTFEIMRGSQFAIWSEEALLSWKMDLMQANAENRNLMAEKYAYMMQDTAPEQFERICHLLPGIMNGECAEKRNLVLELTEKQVSWREEAEKKYSFLRQQGRFLRKEDAQFGETSVETYAYGELMTYSYRTLELLKQQFEELEKCGMNPGICILEDMVKQYEYQNLEDAQRYWTSGE